LSRCYEKTEFVISLLHDDLFPHPHWLLTLL
jgi:hypothetical protein